MVLATACSIDRDCSFTLLGSYMAYHYQNRITRFYGMMVQRTLLSHNVPKLLQSGVLTILIFFIKLHSSLLKIITIHYYAADKLERKMFCINIL